LISSQKIDYFQSHVALTTKSEFCGARTKSNFATLTLRKTSPWALSKVKLTARKDVRFVQACCQRESTFQLSCQKPFWAKTSWFIGIYWLFPNFGKLPTNIKLKDLSDLRTVSV